MAAARRAMRLPDFGYGPGYGYFVTACTASRACVLSSLDGGRVTLSPLGRLVQGLWQSLPDCRRGVAVDVHAVMPNHLHGILILGELCHATLPGVIGGYKAAVTRLARASGYWGSEALWQRGYHERVIRNEQHLRCVREYIMANPFRWRG